MSIESGYYIITNVKQGNVAFLADANDGSPLEGRDERDIPGEKWDVKARSNGYYSIFNLEYNRYAIAKPRAAVGETVEGRDGDQQWHIQGTPVPEQYTIATIDTWLVWGLDDNSQHTPITLSQSQSRLDGRYMWTFKKIESEFNADFAQVEAGEMKVEKRKVEKRKVQEAYAARKKAEAEVTSKTEEVKAAKREAVEARKLAEQEVFKRRKAEAEVARQAAQMEVLIRKVAEAEAARKVAEAAVKKGVQAEPRFLNKFNMDTGTIRKNLPDLGKIVPDLTEDAQKVILSLHELQRSLDGTSSSLFAILRMGLKDQWTELRGYLQRCYDFGEDMLTLKDGLENQPKEEVLEFLEDMKINADALRGISRELKSRDISNAFWKGNESEVSAKTSNLFFTEGVRNENLRAFIVAIVGPNTPKYLHEVDNALERINSNFQRVFEFWDATSEGCISLIKQLKTKGSRISPTHAEKLMSNWKRYQGAIQRAIVSITKTGDMIIVEGLGHKPLEKETALSRAGA